MTEHWSPARIKLLRKGLGLTQKGLAAKLGVKPATVLAWENGHRSPHRYIVPKLQELQESMGKKKEGANDRLRQP
ncbi:MAG: helix-turn-helix transcriptional regulator [Dehalococcoidia bacterium]|nr:helix-turn-helix transcriptional regulator [Dehalococcoidia bacterium]